MTLPIPPVYKKGSLSIPKYLNYEDESTKWMLNLLRNGTDNRLSIMLNQKPSYFMNFYQIPDFPSTVCNDQSDDKLMFHKRSVLYLNSLCLSIYMKKIKAVEMILRSGLVKPNQCSYGTDVFTRGSSSGKGDILEILPICIAIRREFFSAIPLLVCPYFNQIMLGNDFSEPHFSPKSRFQLQYINKDASRIFRYRDCLHYGTEMLKKVGNFPLAKFIDTLLVECSEHFLPNQLDTTNNESISIFRRLARICYKQDSEFRISLQIFQSLEVILKHKCIPWDLSIPAPETIDKLHYKIETLDECVLDQYVSFGTLIAIYGRIVARAKTGLLVHLGDLIYKVLNLFKWREQFLALPEEKLCAVLGQLPDYLEITAEMLTLVKRHICSIRRIEKERELRLLGLAPNKRPSVTSYWKPQELPISANTSATMAELGMNDAAITQKLDSPRLLPTKIISKPNDDMLQSFKPAQISDLNEWEEETSGDSRLSFFSIEDDFSETESLAKYMAIPNVSSSDSSQGSPIFVAENEVKTSPCLIVSKTIPAAEYSYKHRATPDSIYSQPKVNYQTFSKPILSNCQYSKNKCDNLESSNYKMCRPSGDMRSCQTSLKLTTPNADEDDYIMSNHVGWNNANAMTQSVNESEDGSTAFEDLTVTLTTDVDIQEYENSVLNMMYGEYKRQKCTI